MTAPLALRLAMMPTSLLLARAMARRYVQSIAISRVHICPCYRRMMLDRTDASTEALLRAVAGHYRLEREIGRGGMGVVYLATDEQLARPVAIKTLPPHLSADPQVRDRFLREARTAGALSHPGIVPIYSGAERDGVVYFVMRYIDGLSLAERITREGPLPSKEVAHILLELASALGYAHKHGVVHRDIKAENVLLDVGSTRPMLTDFGIARVAETQPLTATGTVLGTVQYMSPEQVSGDTLDGRSDLYSLGVLGFYALSGRFPFERPTASANLVAHVTMTPPKLGAVAPGVSKALASVIDRLLLKSPSERYASAEALKGAIEDAISAMPGERIMPHVAAPVVARDARDLAPGSAPPSAPEPGALSSTEAQQVWSRAADLQANTGLIVAPAEFSARRNDAPLTSPYDRSLVRESAVDAGIDARYVDRALAERDRALALPVEVTRGVAMQRRVNPLAGTSAKIELETAFDGELDDDGFEAVADEVRRSLGEMVTVSAVGRTLTIMTSAASQRGGSQRRLQIFLASRNGRTSVRAFEDLSQIAGALFGGITGGVGAGFGGPLMAAVIANTRNPLLGIGTMLASVLTAYLGARALFARSARKRETELRELLQRIVARARNETGH